MSFLNEQQIKDVLTKYEWRLHQLYFVDLSIPSITSKYQNVNGANATILKFDRNGSYLAKNNDGIFSQTIRGSWKIIITDTLVKAIQPNPRYSQIIQGRIVFEKGIFTVNETTEIKLQFVIVSDQEFFVIQGGPNTSSAYFFKPNL